MSGEFDSRALFAAVRAEAMAKKEARGAEVPVILVPTPAQLAAGARVIDASADQIPRSAATFRAVCESAGLVTRLTYSCALMPASASRAGGCFRSHHTFVRFQGDTIFGYAGWELREIGNASWSSIGGQWMRVPGWPSKSVGVKELEKIIKGRRGT